MYISKIQISNIKCFKEVSIDFRSGAGICNWAVILGDNGFGKTTILRCIAMGLCGETSISGLMDELEGEWLRKGTYEGKISLEILPNSTNESRCQIETHFHRDRLSSDIKVTQTTDPEQTKIPWDKFFVCGYGASRGVVGAETYSKYSVVDSVYTLFNYDAILQNPELVIRRIASATRKSSDKRLKGILTWIDNILMLPKGSTKLGVRGLTVSGSWGKSMPMGALADGHQATISWIVDLLGWALLYDPTIFERELTGIVMLDEIEQHLHPRWQRNIVPVLKNVFPKLQFIISTHSPLVAANTGKILPEDPESKLFFLSQDDGAVKVSEVEENLTGLNAAQVLSSEAFGYISDIQPRIGDILTEASSLAAKDSRTAEEEKRYQQIKDVLKKMMFPEGRTLIERDVERDYYSELEKKIEDFTRILSEGKK